MTKPVEIHVYDFLQHEIAGTPSNSALSGVELHDTVYQKISGAAGIRVGECTSDAVPVTGGEIGEFNARLTLVVFAKVEGKDKSARADALSKCWKIQLELIKLLNDNPDLGGRVCDVLIDRSMRGYDSFDGNPYAVANIPITVNPMGESYK